MIWLSGGKSFDGLGLAAFLEIKAMVRWIGMMLATCALALAGCGGGGGSPGANPND